MKASISRSFYFVKVCAGLLSLVGCATSNQGIKEDPQAAARSRAYLDNVEWVVLENYSSKATCSGPADYDKPIVHTGDKSLAKTAEGEPSKDWKSLVEKSNACVRDTNWKSLEALGTALARLDMDSPWGSYFLSLAAEGTGDYQRALWMADLAQKKAGGRSGLFSYQKGRVFFAMNEVSLAMKQVKQALDLDTKLADGHFFLGEIYQRDLEDKQATSELEAALSIAPSHYGALVHLGDLKLAQSAGDESVELFKRAIKSHPERLEAWVKLGDLYETVKKDPTLALETYRNLKTLVDRGSMHERPGFDLGAKIKTLESTVPARVPAQASSKPVDQTQSVK